MQKKKYNFKSRVWNKARKETLGSAKSILLTVVFALVVAFSRIFVFGRNSGTNYILEFILDFVVTGTLFSLLWFLGYGFFLAPHAIGKEQEDEISNLKPVEANIEISIPDEVFEDGDKVNFTIRNKNKTADIEKCFARFECIGSISTANNQIYWFQFEQRNYQKNILWNRKGADDGTVTIAAGGKDILDIAEITSYGFDFLFYDKEKYSHSFLKESGRSYEYLLQLRIYGRLNEHPIEHSPEFYVIHIEFHPTVKQGRNKKPDNQDLALDWANQTVETRFQIRKAEIDESKIRNDKGIRIR